MDIEKIHENAKAAAKRATRWVYRACYVGGAETIKFREPCDRSRELSTFHSWDYATVAGVSGATARRHLRRLAQAGEAVELKRHSSACMFRLTDEETDRIGREHIAELK